MYRKVDPVVRSAAEFELANGCKLAEDNRWVMMAKIISWSEFEAEYAQNFATEMGAPAKSFRMALGALIIKEKLGISARETVEQIKENPYLQYFIGKSTYSNEAPFDPSLLVHFIETISADIVNKINQEIVMRIGEASTSSSEKNTPKNKLISQKIASN